MKDSTEILVKEIDGTSIQKSYRSTELSPIELSFGMKINVFSVVIKEEGNLWDGFHNS